jgi:hypothetical protein
MFERLNHVYVRLRAHFVWDKDSLDLDVLQTHCAMCASENMQTVHVLKKTAKRYRKKISVRNILVQPNNLNHTL